MLYTVYCHRPAAFVVHWRSFFLDGIEENRNTMSPCHVPQSHTGTGFNSAIHLIFDGLSAGNGNVSNKQLWASEVFFPAVWLVLSWVMLSQACYTEQWIREALKPVALLRKYWQTRTLANPSPVGKRLPHNLHTLSTSTCFGEFFHC